MKKFVLAAVVAAVAVPAAAAPGDTDSETGTANATIVSPISVTHTSGAALEFGVIVPDSASPGTVTVSTAGVRSVSGVVGLAGITTSADSFLVQGETGRSFSFTTNGGTLTSGGNSMTFVTTTSASGGTIVSGGNTFTVGGTLTVGAALAAGSYSGSYTATATYN
ncbi:MAG: DUF4402 domain-containing protein [Erythrobacter sp.]